MLRVYKKTGQARDEGVSIKRSSASKKLKKDLLLEVDSAFERQSWTGCSGSLIIEVERHVHKLKCWEIRTLQMCA